MLGEEVSIEGMFIYLLNCTVKLSYITSESSTIGRCFEVIPLSTRKTL